MINNLASILQTNHKSRIVGYLYCLKALIFLDLVINYALSELD